MTPERLNQIKPSYIGLKTLEGAQLWENSLCCMITAVTRDRGRLLVSSRACISHLKCPHRHGFTVC